MAKKPENSLKNTKINTKLSIGLCVTNTAVRENSSV